jgi:hypothetical protein
MQNKPQIKGTGMRQGEPPKQATLVGRIAPGNWDNEGNVIGVRFQTENEQYEIELNVAGQELFDFLDEEVKVVGICGVAKNGTQRIRVSSYEVLREEIEVAEGADNPGGEEKTD